MALSSVFCRRSTRLIALWIVFFCGLKTVQHLSFGTNACDLSTVDYGLFYTLKGEVMANPFHQYAFGRWDRIRGDLSYVPGRIKGWESHFALHFSPVLFTLVPFYAVFPGPLILLYLEVIAVGLSGLFLYLIGRSVFDERRIPASITIVYLFYRQLLIGLMHDFHVEMLFPFFVLGGYYSLVVAKRRGPAFFLMFLALLVREDAGIYVLSLAVFSALWLKEKRFGLRLALVSLSYVLLVMIVIIPFFRTQAGAAGFYVYGSSYGGEGGGFIQVLANVWHHPALLFQGVDLHDFLRILAAGILAPLLFLPLFSYHGLLLIPPLAIMVFSKIPQMYTFGLHYSSIVLPFLFLGVIYGLKNVRDHMPSRSAKSGRLAMNLIVLVLVLVNLANSNIWRIIRPGRYKALSSYGEVKKMMERIPAEASLAAQSALIPHLPKRKAIDMLPAHHHNEYVVIHTGVNPWPYRRDELDRFVEKMEKDHDYALLEQRGQARLYKRKT